MKLRDRIEKLYIKKNFKITEILEDYLTITNIFDGPMQKRIDEVNLYFEYILKILKSYEVEKLIYFLSSREDLINILYEKRELISIKLNEINNLYYITTYLKSLDYLNLEYDQKEEVITLFIKQNILKIQNIVLYGNVLTLSSNEREKFINYINLYYIENKSDIVKSIILNIFYLVDKKDLSSIEKNLDDIYIEFFYHLIDELLMEQKLNFSDMICIGNGHYSEVFKIGDKIIKIVKNRTTNEIPNSEYILQPLIRYNLTNKEGKIYGNVEITEEVDIKNITDKDVYNLYKNLRKQNIIWNDPKRANTGRLKKKNFVYLNSDIIPINQKINGFFENNTNVLDEGELVVLDSDFLYQYDELINDKNMKITSLEEKYQEEIKKMR